MINLATLTRELEIVEGQLLLASVGIDNFARREAEMERLEARIASIREQIAALKPRPVTPFSVAYPTPWRLGRGEVVDRDGCNIQDFDDDPDTVEFWRGVVEAVNHDFPHDPINLQGSGPAPISPREG